MEQEISKEKLIEQMKESIKRQKKFGTPNRLSIETKRQIVEACSRGINKKEFLKNLGISQQSYYVWKKNFNGTKNFGRQKKPYIEVYDVIPSQAQESRFKSKMEIKFNILDYSMEFIIR